ncbi:LamG-like jellyroll fold domain-containing protein [Paenibacillus sp. FSL H8-0034]|uniref:LamG-like jellyroll fold domain-containing protein n=1 Tax=Paenibacillus sp. FSL H8-0034 TaxID=2954671 RepID=UPI0030F5EC06
MFLLEKRVLIRVLILCMLLSLTPFIGILNHASAATTLYVSPQENNDYLINPGKGWVVYSNFANANSAVWKKASVGYARFNWKDIHIGDNSFNWTPIDNMYNAAVTKGKKFAFGVMPVQVNSSSSYTSMPQWVIDAGAQYYYASDAPSTKVPVWNDPVFISKMGQFITALKDRYNGDPNIEFIDARTFGNWGEWHLGGLGGTDPGDAVKRRYIDQWSGFDQTHIIVPISGGTGMYAGGYGYYARDTYGFGAREDSSDYSPRWQKALSFLNIGPAVGEWSFPYEKLKLGQGWTGEIWYDGMVPGQINGSKYSYQPLGEWNGTDANTFLSEKGNLVDEWQNKMGYWFKMTEAAYPSDLGNGTTGSLTFKMRNDGVAPLYMKGNTAVVKLALLDSSNHVLATSTLSGVNPFDWKPGQTVTNSTYFSFTYNANATKLALGVFSKASMPEPDIKLGINNGTSSNWYVLSEMPSIPAPTPVVPAAGQVLWLKADSITGLNSGDNVSTFADSSGSSNHAVQNTSTKRPKYYANVVNGKAVLRFDGIDDYMSMGSPASLNLQNNTTIFTVAKSQGTSIKGIYGRGEALRISSSDTVPRFLVRNTSHTTKTVSGTVYSGTWNALGGTYSNSDGNLNFYKNGAWIGTDYLGGQIRNVSPDDQPNTIGAYMAWHTGDQKYIDYFFQGDIAEVIIYNRVLTVNERQDVFSYLSNKYGL